MKKIRISKKFVYLISPPKIDSKNFFDELEDVFKTKKISFFQLRLKKTPKKKILYIGKKVFRLCKKYNVKFIINDDPYLVKKINADGCHIGQEDMDINKVKKILKNKLIGITCHNSKKLIKKAMDDEADYIAIGAFYSSKTKKTKFKADIKLLKYAKKITKIPIIVIGGIKFNNYKKLLLNRANFLAISGYVWNSKKYKPKEAIQKLK